MEAAGYSETSVQTARRHNPKGRVLHSPLRKPQIPNRRNVII